MILRRIRFVVKRGHFQEAVTMIRQMLERSDRPYRVYRTIYGDNDILTFDVEFENLEQLAARTQTRWKDDEEGEFADWYRITDSSETEVLMQV
jgi:hypothetical protein